MAVTGRQRAIAKALTALLPLAPFADMETIRQMAGSKKMKPLPPQFCTWLAAVAYVRHRYTDYDSLLEDGYDRDAARFFVVDAINKKLTEWRSTRFLDPDETVEDPEGDQVG